MRPDSVFSGTTCGCALARILLVAVLGVLLLPLGPGRHPAAGGTFAHGDGLIALCAVEPAIAPPVRWARPMLPADPVADHPPAPGHQPVPSCAGAPPEAGGIRHPAAPWAAFEARAPPIRPFAV